MFFESVAEDGCVTQLHFKDSDGRIHLSLNIMYSAEGYLYLSENNVNGTGQNKLIEGANLPFGEWFTLRVEFYRTEKTDSTRVKIYTVDAEGIALCISDINAYNASAIGSSTPLANLEIAHQRTNTATLYIDDVSFTKTEKKYAEETVFPISKDDVLPKEPDEPSVPVLPPEPDDPDDPETPNEPADSDNDIPFSHLLRFVCFSLRRRK